MKIHNKKPHNIYYDWTDVVLYESVMNDLSIPNDCEQVIWLRENMEINDVIMWYSQTPIFVSRKDAASIYKYYISFKLETDAMAFKLRWM
jgi:hypothetical protein